MKISETFLSIQGEGQFAGTPSFFIRTSGCNLRCIWCDTPYTSWRPEGGIVKMDELFERAINSGASDVVITGGEPMMWLDEVAELTTKLRARGKIVTIETNGTIYSDEVRPNLWSVSPKLRNSFPADITSREGEIHAKNNQWTNLRYFIQGNGAIPRAQSVQFKFVIAIEEDLAEVERATKDYIADRHIWVMPEGRTIAEVLERGTWLAEECKKRNWKLCLRQHVLLWGNKRGV